MSILTQLSRRFSAFLKRSTPHPSPGAITALVLAEADYPASKEEFSRRYDEIIFDPIMRTYYGGSGFYNVGYWSAEIQTQAQASQDLVDRLLASLSDKPSKVLDVACGLGATTSLVKIRWPEAAVTGINISEKQIQDCRQRVPQCAFEPMDATKLEFPDSTFDALLCVEAAFHFNSRVDFFRQAHRVLKPGGSLLLADAIFTESAWAGAWTVPQSNAVCSLQEYESQLVEAGFQAIRLEDATEVCWQEFCRRVAAWLDAGYQAGTVDHDTWRNWQHTLPGMTAAIQHYVLVVAIKTPFTTAPVNN